MALPGREKTFALENCRDLLRKLEREIDRFSAADDVEDRIDCAFNAVVTAWHLCDWVFADLTPDQKTKLQINTLSDLQAEARQCPALHLCQQAANASKHWKGGKFRDPDVGVIVTAEPIGDDQVADPRGWYFYFVDRSGIQSAKAVFESAFEFWTQFIYQNEIAKNLERENYDCGVAGKTVTVTFLTVLNPTEETTAKQMKDCDGAQVCKLFGDPPFPEKFSAPGNCGCPYHDGLKSG